MTPEEFSALAAQGYNKIPLMLEVFADLDTPLSCYLKLGGGAYSFLLESVQGGEKWGRYSIIGLPCRTLLRITEERFCIERDGQVIQEVQTADPFPHIEAFQHDFRVPDLGSPLRFSGGLVGYFGYDTIRYIEPRLGRCPRPHPLNTPDILLLAADELVVFDNLKGKLFIIVHADLRAGGTHDSATQRLAEIAQCLRQPWTQPETVKRCVTESDFVSGFTEEAFKRAVDRIKDYIIDGDCMQVVLSQRLSIAYHAPPLDLYRALRSLNPSPYMFYLNMGDFHIVGSSPEILTRFEHGEVTVRPIAGTRRRGRTEEEDQAMEAELLADPKELAEHLMLIDLGRNDIGRICQLGSVRLTERMVVERYSHVMHIVSNVVGAARPGMNACDALMATFPAGTVSGAPKIRAMEIIDELEPVKRGVYAGAVGYIAWNGNMDTAIAIRTAVIKDQQLYVQAGAGIVADSQPALEWKETMNKARALFTAASLAEAGLNQPVEPAS